MKPLVRQVTVDGAPAWLSDVGHGDPEGLPPIGPIPEWLVTNGLGGYASGTVCGSGIARGLGGQWPHPVISPSRSWIWPVLVLALAVTMYVTRVRTEMADFAVYQTAAARAVEAQPLYRADDGHYQFKYLPAFALAMAPFSDLPPEVAKPIWFGLSVALLWLFVAWSIDARSASASARDDASSAFAQASGSAGSVAFASRRPWCASTRASSTTRADSRCRVPFSSRSSRKPVPPASRPRITAAASPNAQRSPIRFMRARLTPCSRTGRSA